MTGPESRGDGGAARRPCPRCLYGCGEGDTTCPRCGADLSSAAAPSRADLVARMPAKAQGAVRAADQAAAELEGRREAIRRARRRRDATIGGVLFGVPALPAACLVGAWGPLYWVGSVACGAAAGFRLNQVGGGRATGLAVYGLATLADMVWLACCLGDPLRFGYGAVGILLGYVGRLAVILALSQLLGIAIVNERTDGTA